MATPAETHAMRQAIIASAAGLGTTSPNPPVGCVVLDVAGNIAGSGFHQRKGEPHAETQALAQAGEHARDGTAVVTLEPCNHVGRTPACRQALLDAGISRVVIALLDPTSRGAGGAAVLRSAGVDVEVGVLSDEAELVLGPWLRSQRTHQAAIIAAYLVGEHGPQILDNAAILTELQCRVDVVLYAGGQIEEANPHGKDVLHLPERFSVTATSQPRERLFATGVRSALLLADDANLRRYLDAGLIDSAITYCPIGNALTPWACPPGFQITAITRTHGAVRTDSAPPAK